MSVERERQAAVDAEGARCVAAARRRHAVAAVVVDVGGAERDARELAEQVGLLVGQRAAAEDCRRHPCRAYASSRGCRGRCGRARSSSRAGTSRPARSRTSGSRSRSGCSSVAAAFQPLAHSAPRVDGKRRGCPPRQRRCRARDDAALQRAVRAMRLDGVGGRCGHGRRIPVQDARPTGPPARCSDKSLILLAKSLSRVRTAGGGVTRIGVRECSPSRDAPTEMLLFGVTRAFLAVAGVVRRHRPPHGGGFCSSKNVGQPVKRERFCLTADRKLSL